MKLRNFSFADNKKHGNKSFHHLIKVPLRGTLRMNFKQQFDEFCAENEQCKIQPTDHQLDRNALLAWKEQMLSVMKIRKANELDDDVTFATITTFVERFSRVVCSVPVSLFETTLRDILEDVKREIKRKEPVVLFLDPKDVRKSNFWIAILAWNTLKDIVTHVCDFASINKLFEPNSSIQILVLDDASYTGSQIVSKLNVFKNFRNAKMFVAIPFVSFEASTLIQDTMKNRKFFISKKAIMFKPLYDVAFDYTTGSELGLLRLSGPSEAYWGQYFGYKKRQRIRNAHVIFFNHKLGDSLSSYPQIILHAPIPPPDSNDIELTTFATGLVTNCNQQQPPPETIETLLAETNAACPVPIYKTFPFTFRKHPVQGNVFELFVGTCILCRRISDAVVYACTGSKCKQQGAMYCSEACADAHWYAGKHYRVCGRNFSFTQ